MLLLYEMGLKKCKKIKVIKHSFSAANADMRAGSGWAGALIVTPGAVLWKPR